MLVVFVGSATEVVQIEQIRGEYELNFGVIYEVPIYPDIETMIALPAGYKITLAMPGSPDYVSATVIQNTIYLTRPVDHRVETNVAVHVITPDGIEEKLMIRCVGPRKGTKVLAVHFTRPNTSEVNRIVESMRGRFTEQLNIELSRQEKRLNEDVHEKTLADARYLFIRSSRKKVRKEYKGAEVYLDGMINSRDYTYIYMVSTVKQGECDIVGLEKVSEGDKELTPELVSVQKLAEGAFYYCWSVPRLRVPEKKTMKVEFNVRIWSKVHTLSAKVS